MSIICICIVYFLRPITKAFKLKSEYLHVLYGFVVYRVKLLNLLQKNGKVYSLYMYIKEQVQYVNAMSQ